MVRTRPLTFGANESKPWPTTGSRLLPKSSSTAENRSMAVLLRRKRRAPLITVIPVGPKILKGRPNRKAYVALHVDWSKALVFMTGRDGRDIERILLCSG